MTGDVRLTKDRTSWLYIGGWCGAGSSGTIYVVTDANGTHSMNELEILQQYPVVLLKGCGE
jgi:hypothetical protein